MSRLNSLRIEVLSLTLLFLGCSSMRRGTYPWIGKFPEVSDLGMHKSSEKGGQVYTLKVGPIDINHVRIVVDDAKHVYSEVYSKLVSGGLKWNFKVRDSARYFVDVHRNMSEDSAHEVSIEMAKYFSYVDSVWHEVLSWYGKNTLPWKSDYESAFSCEDNMSNALGVHVFEKAVRDRSRSFNEAVSYALQKSLVDLGAQPSEIAEKTSKHTKGARHFDIGLRKGYLLPWNVPGRDSEKYVVPKLKGVNWSMEDSSKHGKRAFRSIGASKRVNEQSLCDIVRAIERSWVGTCENSGKN
jgi:hypothetical protein